MPSAHLLPASWVRAGPAPSSSCRTVSRSSCDSGEGCRGGGEAHSQTVSGQSDPLLQLPKPPCGLTRFLAPRNLSSVQLLSLVRLFATPWTAALQASLSITTSRSLLRLLSIASVMPSNHLILCRPLLLLSSIFPSIRIFFQMSQFSTSGGQRIGASASGASGPHLAALLSCLEARLASVGL